MNELPPFIDIGSLVRATSGGRHHNELGIVTRIFYPDEHGLGFDERLVQVLYPHSGKKFKWDERSLEAIA